MNVFQETFFVVLHIYTFTTFYTFSVKYITLKNQESLLRNFCQTLINQIKMSKFTNFYLWNMFLLDEFY